MTYRERAAELKKRFESVSKKIDKIRIEILSTRETSNQYWAKIQQDLRTHYETLKTISADWINAELPKEYNASVSSADSRKGVVSFRKRIMKESTQKTRRMIGFRVIVYSNLSSTARPGTK